MLLRSVHTLANLALKETVPPKPRTSLHVTGLDYQTSLKSPTLTLPIGSAPGLQCIIRYAVPAEKLCFLFSMQMRLLVFSTF